MGILLVIVMVALKITWLGHKRGLDFGDEEELN